MDSVLMYFSNIIKVAGFIFAPVIAIIFTVLWVIGRLIFLPLFVIIRLIAVATGFLHGKHISLVLSLLIGLISIPRFYAHKWFVTPSELIAIFRADVGSVFWVLYIPLSLLGVIFVALPVYSMIKTLAMSEFVISNIFRSIATYDYFGSAKNLIINGFDCTVSAFKRTSKKLVIPKPNSEQIVNECKQSAFYDNMSEPCVEVITLGIDDSLRYLTDAEKFEITAINAWYKVNHPEPQPVMHIETGR